MPLAGAIFVVEITRPCHMDEMRIDVETRDACNEATALAQGRLLASHVKDAIGITARVTAVCARTLPRSTSKARRIYDLRGAGSAGSWTWEWRARQDSNLQLQA